MTLNSDTLDPSSLLYSAYSEAFYAFFINKTFTTAGIDLFNELTIPLFYLMLDYNDLMTVKSLPILASV